MALDMIHTKVHDNVRNKKSNSNSKGISMSLQCKKLTLFGGKVSVSEFNKVVDLVRL